MVSLAENRQTVYYAELLGYTDVLDDDGYKTGEKEKSYSEPQPFLIYVSPSRGDAAWMPFGISHEYTNVMSTCDRDCPITETSVLWIGKSPRDGEGNVTDFNYTVERRAEGLNSILYAIKRVDT